MKLTIFIILISFEFLYSQILGVKPEYFIHTKNVPSGTAITFSFSKQSKVYCHDSGDWYECTDCPNPTEETTVGNVSDASKGWEICWDTPWDYEPLGYGLFKFKNDLEGSSSYFFIDMRDANYSHSGYSTTDFTIRYDHATDTYEWINPGYNQQWNSIHNKERLQIWAMKSPTGNPDTSPFQDFWSNCLGLNNNNDHPKLVWGPHPSMSGITNYRVYRAVTVGPASKPEFLIYSLRATVNSNTYSWTDPDVTIGGSYNYNYYYVKAYNGSIESSRSNIVYTPAQYYKPIVRGRNVNSNIEYTLHQNYPNPSNPTTTISFDLPKESYVELQIYDIQGKIISTLINKNMDSGSHSAKFNSEGLPSGIYFYRLKTVGFSDIKRMLIVK